jgi:hypothetical protein
MTNPPKKISFEEAVKLYQVSPYDDIKELFNTTPPTDLPINVNNQPEKEFQESSFRFRIAKHWGQRKLFLTELEFLTKFYKMEIKAETKHPVVVYAGAANGEHIKGLINFFPNVIFHLYDTAPFHESLYQKEYKNNIFIHPQLFLEADAEKWKQELYNNPILLISDIRSVNNNPKFELEKHVHDNMQMQMKCYQIINPTLSLLKFRLPLDHKEYEYLDGELNFQPYAPRSTLETRLTVLPNANKKIYDVQQYSRQMAYFCQFTRFFNYNNPLFHIDSHEKKGLDNKYDSVREINIIEYYLSLKKKPVPNLKIIELRIINMSNTISTLISKFKSLINFPLPYADKLVLQAIKYFGHIDQIEYSHYFYNQTLIDLKNKNIDTEPIKKRYDEILDKKKSKP